MSTVRGKVRVPREHHFTSRLRSPTVTARVGLWLGIAFGIAFVTGLGATRILPTGVRPPVMIGALCTLTLLAVSAPVLLCQGALADNPTVLNRNYPAGLGVALLVVWAAVALVLVVRLRRKAGAAA